MKTYPFIIFLIIYPLVSNGQVRINGLTKSEFYNIEINGQTLQDVMDTKGVESSIQSLFGADSISASHSQDPHYKWSSYTVDGVTLSFSDFNDNNYLMLTGFRYKAKATFKIKGITVSIGDYASKLGQVVVNRDDGTVKSILYSVATPDGKYWDLFIVITIISDTNLIAKIEYYVPT